MKIIFIIDQVYLHGGIERVLSIKANYFAKKKEVEVCVLTTEQKGNKPCYHFDEKVFFKDLGINYHRNKSYFHPVNLRKIPKHVQKLKSEIKRLNPDIVVVCSHSTDTYFIPFINKKIPKIKEFHYSKHIELKSRQNPENLYKKYFLKYADYVEGKYDALVVLNKDEATYYKTDNTCIIPNPLTFYPKEITDISQKVVIAAGRIAPVKGYDTLIDIWNQVYSKNKDWKLYIYGEGNVHYKKKIGDKIVEYGLQEVVSLKGATDRIKDKMLNSSIFVMTSHNECFPLVLLEAQSCGLPIVSFDCPHGPRNIIDPDTGVLVPLYNNVVFVEKLIQLMDNKEELLRMSKNARENSSKYQLEIIMGLWEQMFNNLISK
ncbi:glycosyltransferase family 4 protein [Aquimarina sp. I32.4]|uniref:glycosyltransferase family 4 protein n=1 Tax=Aquimarina sp. I32.4 TaxID=2053903 RepID=UPI000CDEFD3A|nr:glycosyltransferase family 4 protein [Aquimarina sp. I32.4]